MMLPTSISHVAIQVQRAFDEAHVEILGAFEKENLTAQEHDKIEILINEKLIAQSKDNEQRRHTDPNWDQEVLDQHKTALIPLRVIEAGPTARGLDALLMAQVTGSWTTIETLLGDLWEASLNNLPDPLANLAGQPKRIKAGSGANSGASSSKRESKLVELDALGEHGFDVKAKMGTILKSRYAFSRLAGIREAYSCAFDHDYAKIDKALGNKALDSLNVVRNLIIHRDGRVDAEYFDRTRHLPGTPKAEVGSYISLNGDVVVGLLKPAFTAANSLLIGVDDWIARNASKSA